MSGVQYVNPKAERLGRADALLINVSLYNTMFVCRPTPASLSLFKLRALPFPNH